MRDITIRHFSNAEEVVYSLAGGIADTLRGSLENHQKVRLAVSGGKTPAGVYQALSGMSLEWNRIQLTLVDDRCVGEENAASNLKFIKAHLWQNAAKNADLYGLWDNTLSYGENERIAHEILLDTNIFNGCIILGMGLDGHTASLFPESDGLTEAMHLETGPLAKTITAKKTAVTGDFVKRITMTLRMISRFEKVILLIQGKDKKNALNAALQSPDITAPPIKRLLDIRPDTLIAYAEI